MGSGFSQERLGREFLLWLWYESERKNGLFRLPDGRNVEVWLGERLALESSEGPTASGLSWRGDSAGHEEVRWTLRSGRFIRRAEYILNMDSHEWRFVLDSESLDLSSLRVPRPEREGDEDPVALGLERLYLVEAAIQVVEALFTVFADRRRSPEWTKADEPGIRNWLSAPSL